MRAIALAAICFCPVLPALAIAGAMGGSQVFEPSTAALADIPPTYLGLYQEAATEIGMPWELLAAIGKIESDHGRNPACWKPNAAGAEGPMQFLPATFAQYSWASGNANADIYNPRDAIYAAAALLVDNNVRDDPRGAIYTYNHSSAYVDEVLRQAAIYKADAESVPDQGRAQVASFSGDPATAAMGAVEYALAQLGVPYRWGGEQAGVAFDCSGLVQAAYASVGVSLPRTAQAQHDATTPVPAGEPLQPGDLVFFGTDANHVTHVGIVIANGQMVDAPHNGAVVRTEPYAWSDYLGATRPTA
jgi:cell wall-associated NlpC family hydrolase